MLNTVRIGTNRKIDMYYACVISKLMYSLCTLCLTENQIRLLDSFHIRCLRSIAGIPSTWGATLLGVERLSNERVRCQMNDLTLSDELRLQQMSLLGHILRRPPTTQPELWPLTDFYSHKCWEGPFWGELEEWSGMMLFFNSQRPLLTTITSTGQPWRSIFDKNFLRWHKTRKNGPPFCKPSVFLGAAHAMLLVPHGNEKKGVASLYGLREPHPAGEDTKQVDNHWYL